MSSNLPAGRHDQLQISQGDLAFLQNSNHFTRSLFPFSNMILCGCAQQKGPGEKILNVDLTPAQEERFRRLQVRLDTVFDACQPSHQEALKALWHAAFPTSPLDGLVSIQWKDMGWQGTDPSTDFRGGGFISLENLLFFSKRYPKTFQQLLCKGAHTLSLSLSAQQQQHDFQWSCCTPMNGSSSSGACVVHLLHAESGLTLSYVASLDARVDVGTIAAHFVLQPNSLRLNDYFISRDSHFISGLTWRPLLSFFHSRGFNSGTHALNPVEVQGIPVLQPPMEDISASKLKESFALHEKPGSAKRTAVHSNPVSPFKRSKQEKDSDGIQAMPPCNLKRGYFDDDEMSCMWNKRIRQEVYSGGQQGTDESQLGKEEADFGPKRQESTDDSLLERSSSSLLWKRMKEVKV